MRRTRSKATMGGVGGVVEVEVVVVVVVVQKMNYWVHWETNQAKLWSFDCEDWQDKTSPAWLFSDHASTSSWSLEEILPGRMLAQYCSTTRNSFNILVFTRQTWSHLWWIGLISVVNKSSRGYCSWREERKSSEVRVCLAGSGTAGWYISRPPTEVCILPDTKASPDVYSLITTIFNFSF